MRKLFAVLLLLLVVSPSHAQDIQRGKPKSELIVGGAQTAAQVAAVASAATYTVGSADASLVVSGNVNVTTATNFTFSVTCAYTDETNAARTQTMLVLIGATSQFAASNLITNTTGVGVYELIPLHIRAKAGTSVTLATTGTFTTVVYNIDGSIRKIA